MPAWTMPAALAELHRPIKALAVEAAGIDISEEVLGGDRRMAVIEREDDAAGTGVEGDLDHILGGSRSWSGGLGGERALRARG